MAALATRRSSADLPHWLAAAATDSICPLGEPAPIKKAALLGLIESLFHLGSRESRVVVIGAVRYSCLRSLEPREAQSKIVTTFADVLRTVPETLPKRLVE